LSENNLMVINNWWDARQLSEVRGTKRRVGSRTLSFLPWCWNFNSLIFSPYCQPILVSVILFRDLLPLSSPQNCRFKLSSVWISAMWNIPRMTKNASESPASVKGEKSQVYYARALPMNRISFA
jgi:hypothetical protein